MTDKKDPEPVEILVGCAVITFLIALFVGFIALWFALLGGLAGALAGAAVYTFNLFAS